MKAKTKRRVLHVLTKKKLIKKRTSRHLLGTFLVGLATISFGSLAYAITLSKPVISAPVHGIAAGGVEISAPVISIASPATVASNGAPSQTGRSSWYALGLPAPDTLTCASRTFPRGTYLAVKNLRNDKTVVCRVNDYGPEIWTGRVIDLSRGSFRQVDDLGSGTISVEIRVTTVSQASSGYNSSQDFGILVGYRLCDNLHTKAYCETHRQEYQ